MIVPKAEIGQWARPFSSPFRGRWREAPEGVLRASRHPSEDQRVRRDERMIKRARELRREMTGAELRLWSRIRRRSLEGRRFRRQVPIGPFIADFACLNPRLVIEVDGDSHGDGFAEMRDAHRTEWLERRGFRVLRLWNSFVLEDTDDAVEHVYNTLCGLISPPP